MFELHAISIFATVTSELDPPFASCGIINLMTIMMKTLKKRLNVYTKYILIGGRFFLVLEFTFVFFISGIQCKQHLGLERYIVHSDYLCRTNSQCIRIPENQKVLMYYQRIASLFRGFIFQNKIFCEKRMISIS